MSSLVDNVVWPGLCSPTECVCCLDGDDSDPTGWRSKASATAWWHDVAAGRADDPLAATVSTLARAVVLLSPRLAAEVGVDPDHRAAWSLLRAAGLDGHPEALYRLGFLAQTGFSGHRISSRRALSCYEAAALLGHSRAQFNYGMMLINASKSSARERVDGVRWVQKAASQLLPQALCVVGILRLCGKVKHIPNDVEEGRALLLQSWGEGEPAAACNLGFLHLVHGGSGAVQARRWFEHAAVRNLPEAVFRLANMHWTGVGVDVIDRAKACELWHRAVTLGHDGACERLKTFLERANMMRDLGGEYADFYRQVRRDVCEPRLQCWCCGRRQPLPAFSQTQRKQKRRRCLRCTAATT